MIDRLLGAIRRWCGVSGSALCTLSLIATVTLFTAPAVAQAPPYFHGGVRWLGLSNTCTSITDWTASPLFGPRAIVPPALASFCIYTWSHPGKPTATHVSALFAAGVASQLTEDVPAVTANALPAGAFDDFYAGLRASLRAQVGDASLLRDMPSSPRVRVVVIDSAPDAPAGQISPGLSRHGDTLAHLIEDIVCVPTRPDPTCAAEVTTVLALPWIDPNTLGANGGTMGTLADVAFAIFRAVWRWQNDVKAPPQLVLNLSLGWEDTPGIADCTTTGTGPSPPARAVRAALQYAASQGALIVAAAGNDPGGTEPPTGLLCPGRYQALPRTSSPQQALLVAVSGVDYADRPLQTARHGGITGIAALGFGGVAWGPTDSAPPPLTGSSVATAVASAVAALVWTQRPGWSPAEVTSALYGGGVDVGPADACPLLLGACRSHRVSVCGALTVAGTGVSCSAPHPWSGSSPDLNAQVTLLTNAFALAGQTHLISAPPPAIARFAVPSIQVQPWVFPAPVAITCRACMFASGAVAIELESGQDLYDPVLMLQVGASWQPLPLGSQLDGAVPYIFPLSSPPNVQSAYLTGFDTTGQVSITEQVFVQP